MSLLKGITKFLSGGLGEKIIEGIQAYFPPSMSEQDKANLEIAIKQQVHSQSVELLDMAMQEREQFNKRIHSHEGTAKELQQFGVVGKVIVFLRGCQRPFWGYGTLYIDFMWFSGQWKGMTEQQESALWVVNLLVLGFLFGERAVKNVAPAIGEMFKIKAGK